MPKKLRLGRAVLVLLGLALLIVIQFRLNLTISEILVDMTVEKKEAKINTSLIETKLSSKEPKEKIHKKVLNQIEETPDRRLSFLIEADDQERIESSTKKRGGKVRRKTDNFVEIEIEESEVEEVIEESDATNVYASRIYYALLTESVSLIHAQDMWNSGYKGSGIKIAILDTGIDSDHPMLEGKVILENDLTGGENPDDINGHGTHIAGVVAGKNNSGGFNGIAPEALLINAKVLDDNGEGTTGSIAEGIYWAVDPDNDASTDDGANIISMSFGGPYQEADYVIEEAIDFALSRGVVIVAASGHCGYEGLCGNFTGVTYPGSNKKILTVGAVDTTLTLFPVSGRGMVNGTIKPEIVAPGVDITSSLPNNEYGSRSGTSIATAMVAGAAALLLEKNSSLTHYQIKYWFMNNTVDLGEVGEDNEYGQGLLDLWNMSFDINTSEIVYYNQSVIQYNKSYENVSNNLSDSYDDTYTVCYSECDEDSDCDSGQICNQGFGLCINLDDGLVDGYIEITNISSYVGTGQLVDITVEGMYPIKYFWADNIWGWLFGFTPWTTECLLSYSFSDYNLINYGQTYTLDLYLQDSDYFGSKCSIYDDLISNISINVTTSVGIEEMGEGSCIAVPFQYTFKNIRLSDFVDINEIELYAVVAGFPQENLEHSYNCFGLFGDDSWVSKIYDIKIDKTAPPQPNPKAYPSAWTSDTTPNIYRYGVIDSESGVDYYEYQIDSTSGSWTSVGLETNFDTPEQSDGTHTAYVRAVDKAGNIGNAGSVKIYINSRIDCECDSGACCSDNCYFDSQGTHCVDDANEIFECIDGNSLGNDVYVKTQYKECDGSSATCGSQWHDNKWVIYDDCSSSEYCAADGDLSCTSCSDVCDYSCSLATCYGIDPDCTADGGSTRCTDLGSVCSGGQCVGIECNSNLGCGTDGWVGSSYCSGGDVWQKYRAYTCSNPGTASSSCSYSDNVQLKQNCPELCQYGSCVGIECSSNSECGTDGFTGSPYCSGGDVWQKNRTYTCSNPGTISSSCSYSDEAKLKQECPDLCQDGSCVDVECYSNSECGTDGFTGSPYCSGGDVWQNYRNYSCNNPGIASASCSYSDNAQLKQACIAGCESEECIFEGYLWNADISTQKIYKLNTSGTIVDSFDSPGSAPLGLTWDGKYLWNADYFADKIYKLKTDGTLVDSFDSPGSDPEGLTWDGQYLWNADIITDKIYKLTTNGTVVDSFDSPGSYPEGLTWDGQYLWNSDDANGRIYKLTTNGTVVDSFDSPSDLSTGLAWDGQYLWYGDRGVDKIYRLTSAGNVVGSFDSPGGYPYGLAFQPESEIIECYSDSDCGKNSWIDSSYCNGDEVWQIYRTYSCNNPGTCNHSNSSQLKEVCEHGCESGRCIVKGYLWNVDYLTDKIYKLTTNGTVIDSFDSPGDLPTGLTWDGQYLWNGDYAKKIYKLTTNGTIVDSFDSPGSSPTGLTWDGQYLWNADSFYLGRIYKLTTNGTVVDSFDSPGYSPTGLTWDGLYLWNVDHNDGRIYKLTTNGTVVDSFDSPCCGPNDLTWDGHYIWLSKYGGDDICKLTTNGTVLYCFNSPGKYPPGNYPYGLAFQPESGAIDCSSNSDCGTDSWLGNPYCSGDDVWQKYRTYTCSNAGTVFASCSYIDNDQLYEDCGNDYCGDWSNNFCQDGDVYHLRTCYDKGCSAGSCYNTPFNETEKVEDCTDTCYNGECVIIECYTNSDCGTDGYVDDNFCLNDDVNRVYRTYTCNNPGVHNAYCSYTDENRAIEDCGDDYCDDWGANFCQDGDVYHLRTCYDKGCSAGSCYNTPFNETEKVNDCEFGCSNDACNPDPCEGINCEPYCVNYTYHSEGSCVNGSCVYSNIQENSTSCNWTEPVCYSKAGCGTDDFINNTFCYQGNVWGSYRSFKCNNPGVHNAYCSYTDENKSIENCGDDYCDDWGANFCQDDDVYHLRTCYDKGCSAGSCYNTPFNETEKVGDCTDTCYNGECVTIECYTNSDCGTDGYVGDSFCLNDDVNRVYRTYTCNNPGVHNAYCSYTDENKSIEDCGDNYCDDWGDNFCQDGDVYHLRTCYDKACSAGSCYNTPFNETEKVGDCTDTCYNGECVTIECYKNEDCGTDGYVGDNFCLNDDVYSYWREYVCLNSGTISASCSYDNSTQLKQRCDYGCDNGQCIAASCSDSDGFDYYVRGHTVDNDEDVWDYCNGNYIYEYYCDNNEAEVFNYRCPYGCNNDVCNGEDVLTINSYSPTSLTQIIDESDAIIFTIDVTSSGEVEYEWYLGDTLVSTKNSYTYQTDTVSSGVHTIKMVVINEWARKSVEWTITVNDVIVTESKSDLTVEELKVTYPKNLQVNQLSLIQADFKNIGNIPSSNIKTRLHDGEKYVYGPDINLDTGSTVTVVFATTFNSAGGHIITAGIDYDNLIEELDEDNNELSITKTIS